MYHVCREDDSLQSRLISQNLEPADGLIIEVSGVLQDGLSLSLRRSQDESEGMAKGASIQQQNGTAAKDYHIEQTVINQVPKNRVLVNQDGQGLSDHAVLIQDFFLDSLRFTSMTDREEEVVEAHDKTLEWLFHDIASAEALDRTPNPTNKFLQWLRSDDSTFWVNGKAGSGKSTLMRFIGDHHRTIEELQPWAGKNRLTTAKFYFWTSGSPEQRSQVGLLRYLLCQLLEMHRELIPITFSNSWNYYFHASTRDRIRASISWTLEELTRGFETFLQHALVKTKICLFIDGLDEFDGDPQGIIQFFKGLTESSNQRLKLCLSSRPWPIFEKAFQQVPRLQLQDLTFDDMGRFVCDSLQVKENIKHLFYEDPGKGNKLIKDLVTRANGVFLWATLVVRSLLIDLSETCNRISDLTEALHCLPTDLDQLFQHILFDIQPLSFVQQASRIFQLVGARETVCDYTRDVSGASLTLWELALANETDTALVFDSNVHRGADNEILDRCAAIKSQIHNQCAGLLKIHDRSRKRDYVRIISKDGRDFNLAHSRITYLHRTVRDFIVSEESWKMILKQTSDEDFDPHIRHLQSYILQLKIAFHEPVPHRSLDEWWPGVVLSMTHARLSQPESTAAQVRLISELNSTLDQYWLSRRGDTWARSTFGSYEQRNKAAIDNPFLSLAAKFGLTAYVASELENRTPSFTGGKPLLGYAIEFLVNRQLTVYPLANPALVYKILDHDGDPNQLYCDFAGKEDTPWLNALKAVRDANRRGWIDFYDINEEGVPRWVKIMKMFVEHGADPNALIVETKWDPEATAVEIIEMAFERIGSWEMGSLRDMLFEKGARRREKNGSGE